MLIERFLTDWLTHIPLSLRLLLSNPTRFLGNLNPPQEELLCPQAPCNTDELIWRKAAGERRPCLFNRRDEQRSQTKKPGTVSDRIRRRAK